MELSIELKNRIEEEIDKVDIKKIKEAALNISLRYRQKNENKIKIRLINNKEEAVAYAASRMPATYGAIYNVLKHCIERINLDNNNENRINSLLDVGAGTGAATWASIELLDIKDILCIENDEYMLDMYKVLLKNIKDNINIEYEKKNLITDEIDNKKDIVIVSYVINEIKKEERYKILNKLLNATNKILIIIEPGTPEGFETIKDIRNYFIEKNQSILAPCPHRMKCTIEDNDWCSFSQRISRSKIHKILKDGDVPYEDEKFSYIAINKMDAIKAENIVLRHPIIEKGKITCKLCTNKGIIENKIITKKDKDLIKIAKKINAGDILK